MAGKKQKKTCKRCGVEGLIWGKVDGRFRLFAGEVAHVCKPAQVDAKVDGKACKFCWVEGMVWGEVDGKPTLFEGGKPHVCKSQKCGHCGGTGEYRWGACINGKPPQFGGTCYQCNGTGTQHAEDMRRNHVYQIHAINRAFGGG